MLNWIRSDPDWMATVHRIILYTPAVPSQTSVTAANSSVLIKYRKKPKILDDRKVDVITLKLNKVGLP